MINPKRDWSKIREDFPVLEQEVHGHPLVYLDNAATSQKPRAVIEAICRFYERDNSNVHRGVHELSTRATNAFEAGRKRAAEFLNAPGHRNIVFTRGTTEAINLVAHSWGGAHLKPGHKIALTEMEHHSNMVPWQMVARSTGAELVYLPVRNEDGLLDWEAVQRLLSPEVKILAFTQVSNTLATINPARELCALARERGITTVVDAAQSAGHMPIDVQEMGCDFLAFSGHKMCGPTGIGVLYGRMEKLEETPPYQGGGEMISSVQYFDVRWNAVPYKFEAGTPNIAGVVGLHAAMDYLDGIGREAIFEHDQQLALYAYEQLGRMGKCRLFGPGLSHPRGGLVSFLLDEVHAHDLVTMADQRGIALRGGHHCCQPLMRKLGVPSTARASVYFYNTRKEIDRMVDALQEIQRFFTREL